LKAQTQAFTRLHPRIRQRLNFLAQRNVRNAYINIRPICTNDFLPLTNKSVNLLLSNFLYVAVNGYPQLSFRLSANDVTCGADHYVVGGTYTCEDPAWTFEIGEAQGHKITLSHTVDG
jgi:hypothetical protein